MSTDTPATPPAGWYPDGVDPSIVRYWDGTAWTESTQPAIPAATEAIATEPAGTRRWYQRKGIVIPVAIVGGLIVISGIANAVNGGPDEPAAEPVFSVTEEPEVVDEPEAEPEPVVETVAVPDVTGKTVAEARAAAKKAGLPFDTQGEVGDDWVVYNQSPAARTEVELDQHLVIAAEKPAPQLTLGQENAIDSALSYLDFSGYSRAGLFQQLTSEYGEGFEPADAEFALAHLEANGLVDWNAEAVESAQSYLDFSSYSRDGLYQQLTSEYGEAFTPEQANHALAAVGY